MSYANPETVKKAQRILEANLKRPSEELFADMVARGIIDERGRVLYDGKPSSNYEKPANRKSNGTSVKKKKPAAKMPANSKSSNGKHA